MHVHCSCPMYPVGRQLATRRLVAPAVRVARGFQRCFAFLGDFAVVPLPPRCDEERALGVNRGPSRHFPERKIPDKVTGRLFWPDASIISVALLSPLIIVTSLDIFIFGYQLRSYFPKIDKNIVYKRRRIRRAVI